MPQKRATSTKARPIRGKEESFTARITPQTREALRVAAEASGHSMSSELEILLQSALRTRRATEREVDPLFEIGLSVARSIIEAAGSGPSESVVVYVKLHELFTSLADHLPLPLNDPEFEKVKAIEADLEIARKRSTRRFLEVEDGIKAPPTAAELEQQRDDLVGKIRSRIRREVDRNRQTVKRYLMDHDNVG